MSVAVAYPEPSKGGRGNSLKNKEFHNINAGNISMARKVLRFCPEMVDDVMAGNMPLSEAYEKYTLRCCTLLHDAHACTHAHSIGMCAFSCTL